MTRQQPDYQRIAEDLRRQIAAGTLAPGEKLPTKLALAALYGVSKQPVEQAIFVLQGEGLLVGHQGKGVFVADKPQV
jgi:DNA-binding GntR family transcriptional regulator